MTKEQFKIDPDAIYRDADIAIGLGLTLDTLRRERKSGRLRYVRKGKCVLYRGSWVLAWLDGSEGGDHDHE
jgi:hypothetical protein